MFKSRRGRGGFSRIGKDAARPLTLGLLTIIFFCQNSFANTNFSNKHRAREIKIDEPAQTLTVGERLVFNVSWMGIPVGIGTLEVNEEVEKAGRRAFHVIAIAETNDFLSKIYPVHDEVHS